MEISVTQF